jgi:hypothetical protein
MFVLLKNLDAPPYGGAIFFSSYTGVAAFVPNALTPAYKKRKTRNAG